MTEYKDTLNLPNTGFEMRAGLAKKEPALLDAWAKRDLYGEIQKARADGAPFVFHDGPPYANGRLHHGHILNKVLKDIVVRDRSMRGFRTGFIPGWDCHGLPIEVQVDKELGKKKVEMSKAEIRKACREYATRQVDIQREEFKRLGVSARWDDPYLTMSFAYEAATLREFSKLAGTGLLYRGLRPVNWCTVHQTALAEAEVEYEDRTSPSIYVAFPLTKLPQGIDGSADLVIWTTTPWTLPGNLAISAHPRLDYVAYEAKGRTRIVARGLVEAFLAAIGEPAFDEAKVLHTWKGEALAGLTYRHPLFEREAPVILGEHVTLETGTGLVHTAPGHGPDDFEAGRRNNLAVLSPVDGRGILTEEAGPFAGQFVLKANGAIIATLQESGALLSAPDDTVVHRYAHCWRCNKPIIMRSTEQWWVALDKEFGDGPSLRARALDALPNAAWIPEWGQDRIRGMLEGRPDWCLSRQRTWGVPIAVLYCGKCDHALVQPELMNKVADIFEREGADAWFSRSAKELVGDVKCPECGHDELRKEEDILDVWFDSGVSYAAVIEREGVGHKEGPPVDLYLEGSDQHRGWFHSSLLCALSTREQAPYRKVVTHGFVVDAKGKKVSKSKGNATDPFKTINQNGAELLRLWVAFKDYRDDIRLSDEILKRLSETYRKVRNTLRFLLGNLSDFDPNTDALPPSELHSLDRYALARSRVTFDRMHKAYADFELHIVMQRLVELCTVELSAFYLDVLKDRLYASAKDSPLRRSAQTALYAITRDLLRSMAPIFCFTAEEAWGHLPRLDGDPDSVHLAVHPGIDEPANIGELWAAVAAAKTELEGSYGPLRELRKTVNGALEDARKEKTIGSSVAAAVRLQGPAADIGVLRGFGADALADLLIVSQVHLDEGGSEMQVAVEPAAGTKCERCWLFREDIGQSEKHPTICGRCVEAL